MRLRNSLQREQGPSSNNTLRRGTRLRQRGLANTPLFLALTQKNTGVNLSESGLVRSEPWDQHAVRQNLGHRVFERFGLLSSLQILRQDLFLQHRIDSSGHDYSTTTPYRAHQACAPCYYMCTLRPELCYIIK